MPAPVTPAEQGSAGTAAATTATSGTHAGTGSEIVSEQPNQMAADNVASSNPPATRQVQDRCVSAACGASLLPAQPELPFLEEMGDGWQRLLELEWAIAAGAEGYRCKTFTVPRDIYVTAFAPQVPAGTHHVAFDMVETPNLADDVFACDVRTPGERKLQPSGVGGEPMELPAGVAMPLRAGQQVYMNLHLFNPRETPLSGKSGMWVKTIALEDVEQVSEVVLVGPLELDVPIGRSTSGSSCTLRAPATVYGLAPHMHFTGVHARATVTTARGEIVLLDAPFDPNEAEYYAVEPLQLEAGDMLNVACTFENTTDAPLHWGDSALAEMCFVNFNVYPALPYGNGPCLE
jgi:hypothetical protein